MTLIDVHALSVSRILSDINFALDAGELLAIVGPNGAGKTTLLRAILGLVPIAGGRIELEGEEISHRPAHSRAGRISYLPQGGHIRWPISVERLVTLGRLPRVDAGRQPSREDRDAIEQALGAADLRGLRSRSVTTLSGGERARAMMARALVAEAPIVFADEPVASLDPAHQLRTMIRLEAESRKDGRAVVVVLHDLALAARFADRVIFLKDGLMHADGPPAEVLSDDMLAALYGIRPRAALADGGYDLT